MEVHKELGDGVLHQVRQYVENEETRRDDSAQTAGDRGLGLLLVVGQLDWLRVAVERVQVLLTLIFLAYLGSIAWH